MNFKGRPCEMIWKLVDLMSSVLGSRSNTLSFHCGSADTKL